MNTPWTIMNTYLYNVIMHITILRFAWSMNFARQAWDFGLFNHLQKICGTLTLTVINMLFCTGQQMKQDWMARQGVAEIFQNRFPVSRKKPARLSLQFVRLYSADIDIAVGFGSTKGSNWKSLMEGCARSIPASPLKKTPTMICQDSQLVLQTPNQIRWNNKTLRYKT